MENQLLKKDFFTSTGISSEKVNQEPIRMNWFLHLCKLLEKFTVFLSIFILSILSINLVVAVFFRYFLNHPIYWSDELSLILFGWITFLGATLGVKRFEMASVSIIMGRLKGLSLFILKQFIHVCILMFAVIVGYYGFLWISSDGIINQMATTIPIPLWVCYLILPVSMILMVIFCIENIYKEILLYRDSLANRRKK